MTTNSILKKNNINKDRLIRVFELMGKPISEPTLNKRLRDQQWSHAHVQLLRQLGIWVEPEYNLMGHKMIEYIMGMRDDI